METMRIVMTSTFYPPYHLGGDAVHVRYLAEELAKRGHEVHVLHSLDAFALKVKGAMPQPVPSEVHTHPVGGTGSSLVASLTYMTGGNRAAERTLEHLVNEVRPDWIHHHNISLLGKGILSIGNVPKLLTSHDHWLACPCSDLEYLGREMCEHGNCNYCSLRRGRPPQLWRGKDFRSRIDEMDLLISPSRYMADFLRERLSLESAVLPNFVPRPDVKPAEERRYFVFVGVLEQHKGLDMLLKGFELCNVKSELHILGRGTLGPMVEEMERRTGGRVKGMGFLPRQEVLKEVAGAIALVSPSMCQENSPLACIEALSMGTPLIVSPHGGLPELVVDGGGMVADPTPESIGSALRMLERQDTTRSSLSTNAMRTYEEHHTPESYIHNYLEKAGGMA
jgi:glycosyltransferase involved in cell wall biosynthesis